MCAARFVLDPTDLPDLIRTVRGWPGAKEYPPLELRRVEVAEDAFGRLGEVIGELASDARAVLVVQDDTAMSRSGGISSAGWPTGSSAPASRSTCAS